MPQIRVVVAVFLSAYAKQVAAPGDPPPPRLPSRSRIGSSLALGVGFYASLGALALVLFHRLAFVHPAGDFLFHVRAAQEGARGGGYPPHFFYHLLLNFLNRFWGGTDGLLWATVLVLTAALLLKVALTQAFAQSLAERRGDHIPPQAMGPILVALLFAAAIPNWWAFPRVYLGQFTPNVWHNPTTIVAIPFALAVLWSLDSPGSRRARTRAAGGLLLAVSVLVKPNFAVTLLPVLFLLALVRSVPIRDLLFYVLPTTACIVWFFVRSYGPGEESGVELRPFAVWLHYTDDPVTSLAVSFAFPAAIVACYGRRLMDPRTLAVTWLLAASSVAQFLLFAERGERLWHGNFLWGTVPALYLLFLASTVELFLQRPRERAERPRFAICVALLALHVLGGIWLLARFWLGFQAIAA